MRLTVLTVPDCPHTPLLRARLDEALADRPDVTVTWREITDPEQAERTGMHGSPTLLVDGSDPFSPPGQPPSLSCHVGDPPTVRQIRAALAASHPE
ncbi:thioredoxin family protein [Streptomyces sp. NPDC050803]|uniref:thioredoxin family protein n=1 Tax=unclassified Streptomyces TaxID=2593676 RepID=UPI00342074C6